MQPFDEFFGEMHMKITLGFDFFLFLCRRVIMFVLTLAMLTIRLMFKVH